MPLYRSPEPGTPPGGSTAQVLAKASATDFDTEWVDQSGGGGLNPSSVFAISGKYLSSPNVKTGGAGVATQDRLYLTPIYPRENISLDQMAVRVGAGAAGAVIRLGIYAADAEGMPTGSALADTTVDASSGGEKIAAISANVSAPIAFLATVIQGGAANIYGWDTGAVPPMTDHVGYVFNSDASGYIFPDAWYVAGVSGALPDITASAKVAYRTIPACGARVA